MEEGRGRRLTDESGFGGERRGLEWVELIEDGDRRENKYGHMKLCARGHWRPHEDAKLKELVVQFGPQNWNLIAEKLQGRSGNDNSNLGKRSQTFVLHLIRDDIDMHFHSPVWVL